MTGRVGVRRAPAAMGGLRAGLLALVASGVLGVAVAGAAQVLPPSQPGVNVYDFAGIWSAGTKLAAQEVVDRIGARTGAQIAVVSWPTGESSVSLGGAAIDARMIMDTWGVGRAGVNDGLVVLFDMDTTHQHGQVYLATGMGYRDQYLSDAEAQAIVDNDILPKARDGDLDGALLAGLAHLDRVTQVGGNPERATLAMLRAIGAVLAVIAGLAAIGLFVRTWVLRGRDARTPLIDDSVLLPAPPPGLTPALATVLRDDLVTRDAFSSALVDLGHRGLVTFRQDDGGLNPFKHAVDLVVPDPPLDDAGSQQARKRPLGVAEHGLYLSISSEAKDGPDGGVLDSTRLKSGIGAKLYADFKKHLGIAAGTSGWFVEDPNRIVGRWLGIGITVAVAAGLLFFWLSAASNDQPGFIKPGAEFLAAALFFDGLVGIAIAVFSSRMAARTADGAQVLAMALAYRNTLRYEIEQAKTVDGAVEATKTKLPWITTPDVLTVWAVALGLNHEIDGLLKRTFETQGTTGSGVWAPVWFSGSGGSSWGGIGGAAGIASAVASVAATSTSSSGGGFGGGGGGGGGGAGGGF